MTEYVPSIFANIQVNNMCGICGFITNQNIEKTALIAMNDTMYHRGPDDSGAEIFPSSGKLVGLAQRRLSILDLSSLGHQPMHSNDGRISVVYNGEIYNFQEIREELKDYSFKSNCDTEVIIASYLKWGIECLSRFNGMFAIALFDAKEECLYLVRDRIGKKPLYYELEKTGSGTNIYFGSELKPIMARPGFNCKIRQDIISRFLYQQYINAPDTVFENVYKLEPGACLKYSLKEENDISVSKYWDIAEVYHRMRQNPVDNYDEAKACLKELLRGSVKSRMISDVPLGTFLSGGYDSSLVSAIAAELSSTPIKTFSIGFNEEKYNEAKYAKEVAQYLGTDHTEMYISEDDMYELVSSIPKYYDEPFADSSQICTMLVSRLAKEKVTVALSGDGGDEFFCGYNIYENVRQAQMLDIPGAVTHGIFNAPLIKNTGLFNKLPFRVKVIANNRNPETKTQFGSGSYVDTSLKMVKADSISCQYETESRYGVKDWQIRRMLLDMDTYLPGDILAKVDRASMRYSLESRCPILDKDVMEYSFRMDHSFKFDHGNKKRILKDIAYDYIPKELLDRPKVGFGVPLDKWLRGPLHDELWSMCDESLLIKQDIFDVKFVRDTIEHYLKVGDGGPATGRNYSKIAWSFFVFQQWYKEYFC